MLHIIQREHNVGRIEERSKLNQWDSQLEKCKEFLRAIDSFQRSSHWRSLNPPNMSLLY